ncbi:MAG: ABC transporter ATP-binding protein [Syntrophomonadaceae bacterium]|mgnify:CR=1 FL=1|jgi:molybdate transport system ATP-binding protein|nr:ABC transporter ATP-binding protein [Syntrophomonadaceae bacterium]
MLEIDIKRVLPGFSLEVEFSMEREIVAILGPSGCGKTMTLKCIAGLMQPDEGRITLDGKVFFDSERGINLPSQERRVGFVLQNYALFPNMTVYKNVAFGMRHRPDEEIHERIMELMYMMRLSGLEHRYPRQLSAGQQQRVALARSLAFEPEVLLLDEPFSALDTVGRRKLEEELQDIRQFYDGYVLFVTHNLAEAYKLSSKIAVYEAGSILQYGDKQQVVDTPCCRTVAHLTGAGNLMDGLVTDVKRNIVKVWIPGLEQHFRLIKKNGINLCKGQEVTIGIRPEYIRMTDEVTENSFKARVTKAIEEVSVYTYRFSGSNQDNHAFHLEASISKGMAPGLSVGQSCCLYLSPERLFVTPD